LRRVPAEGIRFEEKRPADEVFGADTSGRWELLAGGGAVHHMLLDGVESAAGGERGIRQLPGEEPGRESGGWERREGRTGDYIEWLKQQDLSAAEKRTGRGKLEGWRSGRRGLAWWSEQRRREKKANSGEQQMMLSRAGQRGVAEGWGPLGRQYDG